MTSIYLLIDKIWQWISERIFVRFEFDMPVLELRQASSKGAVFFALTSGGLIEWLILSSWCRREGFGPILITNRLKLLLFGKPLIFLSVLFKKRTWASVFIGDDTLGARLIFCRQDERRQLFSPTGVEALLSQIYRTGDVKIITIAPVIITWRKYLRGAARNPSEFLFGLSSRPNILGKTWYLIRRRKDSTVKGLNPFPMQQDASTQSDVLGEGESMHAAKSTRRKILISVNEEMRIRLGPRYVSPTAAKETLIHDLEVQTILNALSKEEGLDKKRLMLRAYRMLGEMVSNYSIRFIEILYVSLTWLFTRVFDGLDAEESDISQLRETLKQKPVVFVSAHRSHLDYLVIPYLLFLKDIVTPHIAAGINLSFWPVGGLLRRGGAFFIRRSFWGDRLYALLLKKYVAFLIQNRFNILFFIEGTRSRTGKLLPPAYGMLKMIMECFQNRLIEDIALVPLSVSYDEVLEQGSYARELAGENKVKEDARALIRSRKVVRRNIGSVYVRMGDAVSVKDIFSEGPLDENRDRLVLQKTAFDLSVRINSITPITPKSLLATILLSQSEPLTLEQILRLAHALDQFGRTMGSRLITTNFDHSRRSIEAILRQYHRSGVVKPVEGSLPITFEIELSRRSSLVFYRNNAIHCFVMPAIGVLSLCLAEKLASLNSSINSACGDIFMNTALKLRNLFKFDFFFSATEKFTEEMSLTMKTLSQDSEWHKRPVHALKGTINSSSGHEGGIYRVLLGDLLESYRTVFQFIKANEKLKTDRKALIQRILKAGQAQLNSETLVFPESVSTQNYGSAVQLCENLGIIKVVSEGEATSLIVNPWKPEFEEHYSILNSLVQIAQI